MKIVAKLEYACRIAICLSKKYPSNEWVSIEKLSKEEQLPCNYLVQILSELRKADLIESRRGQKGGYKLSKKPEMISLHDIVLAMDPSMFSLGVQAIGKSGQAVVLTWQEINRGLIDTAKALTMDQIVNDSRQSMYYI